MDKINSFILRSAQAQNRQVRFIYNTKRAGNLVPRVGKVESVNGTHAVILDAFHDGSPRSVILERIVGEVEIDRTL